MPTSLKADKELTENAVTKRLLIKHFRTVKNGLGMRLALMVVSIVAGTAVHANDCSDLFERLEQKMNAEWLDSVVVRTSGKDFFSVRSSLLRRDDGVLAVQQWNTDLSRALRAQLPPPARRERGMSLREAQDLFEYLNCHPVAGMRHLKKYDPKGNFGFCFGRATAVHLEALRRGLARSRILKIWGVGPMLGGWGHHVAALVAAKEGGWWVIDSELSRVVSAEEWIEWLTTQQASSTNPLVFFVSEAERFGPAPGKYNPVDLYGDEKGDLFNGYFRDLIRPAPEKAP